MDKQVSFRVVPLARDRFDNILGKSDEELRAIGGRRMIADEKPGFPCRVSLVDAEPGEEVILVPFTHHDVTSPYRASGPIFIRVKAETAKLEVNEIPPLLRSRLLSLRAYDRGAMMVTADIVAGDELEQHISRLFADKRVEYLHVHNARPGCFNCEVRRA
jgi:hypothetical protein